MHEGILTQDLFEHVLIHAREANARRVTHVKVTIGALSDFTAESIQFYFSQLAPGTIVEGAELEFESKPGTAKCPSCGKFPVQVTGGDGVYLASLEVETGDEQHEHIHE